MESHAISKENRIAATKVRLIANEIKGLELPEAIDALRTMPQKAARLVLKTLYSAGANAKFKNPDVLEEDLYIRKIAIDEGRTLKRYRARARGRASRIRKRTSNIFIVLSDEK